MKKSGESCDGANQSVGRRAQMPRGKWARGKGEEKRGKRRRTKWRPTVGKKHSKNDAFRPLGLIQSSRGDHPIHTIRFSPCFFFFSTFPWADLFHPIPFHCIHLSL